MKKTRPYFITLLVTLTGVACFLGTAQASPYFSVQNTAQARGFGCQWDASLKNLVIMGKDGNIKLHVGSEFILNAGKFARLEDKVTYSNGQVMAPKSLQNFMDHLTPLSQSPAVSSAYSMPMPPVSMSAPAPIVTPTAAENPGTHRINTIVIDAGHGGHDFGAMSPHGIREKDIVLEVAKLVRTGLERQGIQVVLTRNHDVYIPLAGRAHIANEKKADLFISIHANASYTRSLSGFEIYTLSEATDDTALALERAENSSLEKENRQMDTDSHELKAVVWGLTEQENRKESVLLAGQVADSVRSTVEIAHKRVKTANFYVLKWTELPAILIELGYLTNKEDERQLRSTIYRENMAGAIVSGIMSYKRDFERTDGFTK